MTLMRSIHAICAFTIVLFGVLAQASAVTVQTGSGTIETSDPVETGRILRNGIVSTWAAPKPYPGSNDLDPHFYDLVTVGFAPNAGQTVYYELTWTNLDSHPLPSPYLVAYQDIFVPTTIFSNYLGDAGESPAANTPATFQVIVPAGHALMLVFQDIPTTAGHQDARYTFAVDAFSDAARGENFPGLTQPTPVPAALPLFMGGLGLIGFLARRKKRKHTAHLP